MKTSSISYLKNVFLLVCIIYVCHAVQASQVVLITGASRGIGFTTAEFLASEGYRVYAGVRSSSSLIQVLAAENTYPDHFHPIVLDVRDQKSVDQAIEQIQEKEGRLDVLINNAGIMTYGSIENLTIEEAKQLFDVNFFGLMRVTQAVLPIMRKQEKGKIIQMSSRSGFRPLPSLSIYAASKFALEGVSETMAATLKPWNITVSLIEPGPVNTDLDFLSPYGSRFLKDQDPYYSIFEKAGLLDPISPIAQQPLEIARLIKQVIETDEPLFRYQTTQAIEKQADQYLFDRTGVTIVQDWHRFLFSDKK